MFNLLLTLMAGILIGWTFHAFFVELNTPNILKNDINISKPLLKTINQKPHPLKSMLIVEEKETVAISKTENSKPITKKSQTDSFSTLLEKEYFSDAMALYLDSENKKLPFYRSVLLDYFKQKSSINPQLTISQMQEFMVLEPEHKAVTLQLIDLYITTKEYQEAIKRIDALIENASPSELENLHTKLIKSSEIYLDKLKSSKNFHTMVSFLEERIEIGTEIPFYMYTLAEYYVEIKKYLLATQLLKEIEFDEDYSEKAKNLLELINQKLLENKEYAHKLPLKKEGDHFTIDVTIDNTPLTLLLDTGATLTMINRDKVSSLTVIKENIILQTAGGEINAQLQEAETLSVGDVQLEKFQIVSSSFEQKNADGLLGMNFFKEFKFKIDQDESVLYLSRVESATEESSSY